jgi:hypothetical protein
MNETVKIDLKISRRNVLLLNSVIERGLTVKDSDDKSSNLLDIVPKVYAPVKVTTFSRFKLTTLGRLKLTTLGRSKLTS